MFSIVKTMCSADCKPVFDEAMAACEAVLPAEEVKPMKDIMSMCTPCGSALVDVMLAECDMGDESSKVCDLTGTCMTNACGMASECSEGTNPMGMLMVSNADWKEGYKAHNKALEACPCPTQAPDDTSAATKWTAASSFSVVALLAFFVQNQQ
jgi:hypothetical protein